MTRVTAQGGPAGRRAAAGRGRGHGRTVRRTAAPPFARLTGLPVHQILPEQRAREPANAAPKGQRPRGSAGDGRAGRPAQRSPPSWFRGPWTSGAPRSGAGAVPALLGRRASPLPALAERSRAVCSSCSAICAGIGASLGQGRLYFLQNCLLFFFFSLSPKPRLRAFKQRFAPLT